MNNIEKKDRKKYTIRVGWKRSLIVTLVIALLIGTFSFVDFGPKAQAAEYSRIIGVENYDEGNGQSTAGRSFNFLELEGGRRVGLSGSNASQPLQGDYLKVRRYSEPFTISKPKHLYIDSSNDLFYQEDTGTPKKMASGVKDFQGYNYYTGTSFDSFFAHKLDETVEAWGRGTNGQLGIGYSQDKTVATKVVDPTDPTEDLKGIKKMISLSTITRKSAILLVGDGKVYLIGTAFGKDSLIKAVPVDVTSIFPAFDTADEFDMFRINGEDSSKEEVMRVFEIKGKQYTLRDLSVYNPEVANTYETETANFYPVPDGIDARNVIKISNQVTNPHSGKSENRYILVHLSESKVLTLWGSPIEQYSDAYKFVTSGTATFNSSPQQIATGVDYFSATSGGHIYFVKGGNLFYVGTNQLNNSGLTGGPFLTPIKIVGPANELTDLKKFYHTNMGNYYLKKDGTLLGWTTQGAIFTHKRKYIDLISYRDSPSGLTVVGLGEDFGLYRMWSTSESTGSPMATGVAPKDYIAPVVKPETPILTTTSQDKFDQFTVSVNYGTSADLNVKEYRINGGAWTPYTDEFVITDTGAVRILARSADNKGNISDEGVLQIVSNPIVISAGEPNVTKVSANEFKISAQATGAVKIQVRVDGAAWQNHNRANNLLLDAGQHTIDVRLLNARDEELVNKSFTVTADSTAPVVVPKPTVTQTGLNSSFRLNLDVQYDTSAGEAQYSVDGGTWATTTGTISVSNDVHTVRVKVVATDGTESEVVDFVTTKTDPKVAMDNDTLEIDLGVTAPDLKIYYKDNVNGVWTEYTGPVTYPPGTYTFDIEVREDTSGDVVYSGGPFTLVVPDPNTGNPGNGGTTPTPDPGTGTPVGQEDVDFTVNSGGLSSRFEGADLSTIIIDNTNPYQSINSVSRALLEDSRGNGKGYQYSLDVTDFVSDPMQDNSTNSQNLVVSIPANSLSVDVLNSKTLNGPPAELSNVGKHVFTGTGPEMLATANSFEGMGYYEIPLNFTLSVPDRVKITSSGSGSKFIPGESTGLMAGIYKSKFTFTLSSGI
ncbi:hypothetical protein NST38_31085 [Paenibacillus sp. FSL H8-0104]|uniref:hypothetical protein n=1 Tax=Paenibacillus sp. FSL H8-0104 TaxID=2954509 RepID=UPI0030FDCF06